MSKINKIFSTEQLAQLDKAFDELSRSKNNGKPEIELNTAYKSDAGITTLYIQMGNGARIYMDVVPRWEVLLDKVGVVRMHKPIEGAPVNPIVVRDVRILLNSGHDDKAAKQQAYVEKEMGWTMQEFKDKLNALVFFSSAG